MTYENEYFGLRIDFPRKRKVVSWKQTKKITPSWRSLFQTRDEDMPRKGSCDSKFLFTACLYSRKSEALLDAEIEISVFRLKPGEDMRQGIVESFERERLHYQSHGITTTITKQGNWAISGVDFDYVDEQSKTRTRCCQYRFFFRRYTDVFWLYGKIAGHRKRSFSEAIKIVEAMKCTIES
jgi:hypothetical protein